MYYTNYHKTNRNVETCRVKKKENLVLVVSKVTSKHIKIQKHVRYSCWICGDIKHKIIDCPKYNVCRICLKTKQ
jgi:hypothetical protein